MENWAGVIMAAGQGRRMQSRYPKPLHRICGKELIRYPLELLQNLGLRRIVIVVSPETAEPIRNLLGDSCADSSIEYALQPEARGTGDAAAWALTALSEADPADPVENLILLGSDSPLIRTESAQQLIQRHLARGNHLTLLTAEGLPAGAYGQILRDAAGQLVGIVEATERDQDEAAFSPAEINAGVYCLNLAWLTQALKSLKSNPSGEKYLTALVSAADGRRMEGQPSQMPEEIFGVNDRVEQAQVEAILRWQICERWLQAGVTIQDPASVFIDADVAIGQDTIIAPNTMLLGRTLIGEDCRIGPNSVIQDSQLGHRCRVTASMLEEAILEEDVTVGPFSHLRPGAYLERDVHLGNYVEVKESHLGAETLSGHFCYLGDASIGPKVNIGAGTITCNFDGQDKHRTTIESGAFIGSNTMLVAPVTVGENAATAATAVVNKDVPPGLLAVGIPARMRPRKPLPE